MQIKLYAVARKDYKLTTYNLMNYDYRLLDADLGSNVVAIDAVKVFLRKKDARKYIVELNSKLKYKLNLRIITFVSTTTI